jgi:hypothetical protein
VESSHSIWVSTSPLGHPSGLNTTRIGPIPGMLTVETTSGIRHTCTDAVWFTLPLVSPLMVRVTQLVVPLPPPPPPVV